MGGRRELVEEIGDALYLWIFFMQAAEDSGLVTLEEAVQGIEAKLIRRHPHVFGGEAVPDGAGARGLWEQEKRLESARDQEILGALPAGLPALLRARRIQEKAAAFGFDWAYASEVVSKVREELDELVAEMESNATGPTVQEEVGDLLFALVNLARHLGQDPEATLHAATEKFRARFNAMARSVEAAGHRMGEAPLDLLEIHWQAIKGNPAGTHRLPDSR